MLAGKWFSVAAIIRIDRREYHAAQSGRFVARLQLVPEQLPGALWAPSPPDAGLELSLAERVGLGRLLAANRYWFYFGPFLPAAVVAQ